MQPDPDLIDVGRVRAGDPSGFDGIVRRWQGPLINLAWRFVRDRARAEELAQDAFVQVYRQLDGFRGESAFSTWLFSVALNVFRSALRRAGVPSVPLDAVAELADHRPAHLALEAAERDELVRRAVLSLPPKYRDALVVYYFRECDVPETARILGVLEGTAKALLHRGRELLGRKLGRLLAPVAGPREVTA